jgi:hypothetical protein
MKHVVPTRNAQSFTSGCLVVSGLVFLAAILGSGGGCATSKEAASGVRPGDGIREYRQLVLSLRRSVADTRQTVDAVAAASAKDSAAALSHLKATTQQLEIGSIKARARVEAIEKRGHAYFEEWTQEAATSGDAASQQAMRERVERLRPAFEAVLKESRETKQVFREFLDGLRKVRATLGPEPSPSATEAARSELTGVSAAAGRTEIAMDRLCQELNKAETAVMSAAMPLTKGAGQ